MKLDELSLNSLVCGRESAPVRNTGTYITGTVDGARLHLLCLTADEICNLVRTGIRPVESYHGVNLNPAPHSLNLIPVKSE